METFTRYLKFQLQLFVYGIVGPIFLFFFFAISPNHDLKWMYWWGLIITAADVLIALWLTARPVPPHTRGRWPVLRRSE